MKLFRIVGLCDLLATASVFAILVFCTSLAEAAGPVDQNCDLLGTMAVATVKARDAGTPESKLKFADAVSDSPSKELITEIDDYIYQHPELSAPAARTRVMKLCHSLKLPPPKISSPSLTGAGRPARYPWGALGPDVTEQVFQFCQKAGTAAAATAHARDSGMSERAALKIAAAHSDPSTKRFAGVITARVYSAPKLSASAARAWAVEKCEADPLAAIELRDDDGKLIDLSGLKAQGP
jgi:hypothetical protein